MRQVAKMRYDIARYAEDRFGFTRHRGAKGEPSNARQRAGSPLATWPTGSSGPPPRARPHNDQVRKIAQALFPGARVSDRVLEGGRREPCSWVLRSSGGGSCPKCPTTWSLVRYSAIAGNCRISRSGGIGRFLAICFMKKGMPAPAH